MLSEMHVVFMILSIAIIMLLTEIVPVAITALLVVVSLEIGGILTTEEAFSGFSNSTVILFAAMFIVGRSIFKTGLALFLGRLILQQVGNNMRALSTAIGGLASLMSALLSNTGTTATLMPLVNGISCSAGFAPRKLLMPLALFTSLGGMMTVIGTPPNVIINGILQEFNLEPFGFLEFGKVGAIICVLGVSYLILFYEKIHDKFLSKESQDKCTKRESVEKDVEDNKKKMLISAFILVFIIMIMILDILPLHLAAVIGAILAVLTGCIPLEKAYQAIDWNTIFLFAGMLPLSLALEKTGGAKLIADSLMGRFADSSLWIVITLIFFITSILSQFISNTASAALLAPIALSVAQGMGISPYPLLMTVALSASAAFLTPMATPPNAMVFGEGDYRVLDYVIAGAPLVIISYLAIVIFVPVFFPA